MFERAGDDVDDGLEFTDEVQEQPRTPRPTGCELLSPGMTRAQYLALRAKWYAKLKRSGFVDHECFGSNGDCLTIMRPTPEHNYSSFRPRYHPTIEHFAKCRQYANSPMLRRLKPLDRKIWRLYCDGQTQSAMAARLGIGRGAVRASLRRCFKGMAAWWAATEQERDEEQRAREDAERER